MVQRVGFFGTLVRASIPNPLFDLADKTWFPFGPSFGATLIGKAKIHIQKLFVIITFSRHIVEQMVSLIGAVPGLGASLQKPFREYLEAQRAKMHHRTGEGTPAVSTSSSTVLYHLPLFTTSLMKGPFSEECVSLAVFLLFSLHFSLFSLSFSLSLSLVNFPFQMCFPFNPFFFSLFSIFYFLRFVILPSLPDCLSSTVVG